MCFWRKVFLFSLYYSLANIFSTQAGSNLLLYKLIRWKNFFGRSFQNGGACVDVRKKLKIVDFTRRKFLTYEVLVPGSVPIGSRMTSAAPRAAFLYDPSTWVWIPDTPGRDVALPFCGDSLLPVSVLAWLAPASPFAGCCAPSLIGRKNSVVGKKNYISRSSLGRPNAC